jgi:mannose-6-phosphate isomerase-like protein (cupin superfamily)
LPGKIVSTSSAEHYRWGGPQGTDCDGWHMVRTPELSVIEERMPPGTSEIRHYHQRARQFFYVLEGELTLEVDDQQFVLHAGEGLEISPLERHQAINRTPNPLRMLVTSQPHSHGDRVTA